MNYQLHFSERHIYDSRSEGITVPAVLKTGRKKIELLAKIDTGSSDCIFDRSYGEALGLYIEGGIRQTYSTANSRFEAFGHEIVIHVLGIDVTATAYFFADPSIQRNVLGRRGWLDRIRMGLVDYDQLVYVSHYDQHGLS